jgi:1L-myo-inositol 1-phosphate cytidylyltransferase
MTLTTRATSPRLGLILAAGFGSRLESATGELRLKPLLPVGGKPLILRVIEGMVRVGCKKVVIVTGFAGDELRAAITQAHTGPTPLSFVDNPNYRLSNGLSVLAAQAELTEPFILSMADHVISPAIMDLAAEHRAPEAGATLLVDRKISGVFDLDDATKVRSRDGKIVAIGKQLTEYDCIDTGVFVCTRGLVDAIAKFAAERGDASLSEGVQALAAQDRMEVLDVGDAHWMDVDTPEMLADAEARLT